MEKIKEKIVGKKLWTYQYGENMIIVEATRVSMSLIVNGQVQDAKKGIAFVNVHLKGKLESGEHIIAYMDEPEKEISSIFEGSWTVIVGTKVEEISG